ncbi:hypothetical protein BDQ17DRAFT_1366845, partial [Cyathus striatus]
MSRHASPESETSSASCTSLTQRRDELITRTSGLPRLSKLADIAKIEDVKPLFDQEFATTWPEASTTLYLFLDILKIRRTTIDVNRIGNAKVIWIGVDSGTLSLTMARSVAAVCEEDIISLDNVKVCFRESRFCNLYAKLFDSVSPYGLSHSKLTASHSLPIASQHGSIHDIGGLYLFGGGNPNAIYLLTAKHVLLLLKEKENTLYDVRMGNQELIYVEIPHLTALNKAIDDIDDTIKGCEEVEIEIYQYPFNTSHL